MAVNTLNKEFGHIIPKYDHDLPAKLVCAATTDDCWFNRCPTCSDAKLARGMFLLEESKAVTWYVWGKDGDNKLCKMVKEGTIDDLFDHLCSILLEFLQHCHVKRNQADYKYEVSAMIKAGRYWKWPGQEDKIFYLRDQIVKGLNPPILVNAREHYDFPDFE